MLILIAIDDQKMRIEVGYGLEGAIPDLYAKHIINDTFTPKFKQGDFAGGIAAATDQIIGLIDGEPLPAPSKKNVGASQLEDLLPMLLFGGMISGIFLKGIFGNFFGSALNGGLVGSIVFFTGLSLLDAGILSVVAFFFTMMMGNRGGGFEGGGFGGGMGGDFGGGGAPGSW